MPYVLEKMLTVRTHRENKALNRMVKSKAELEQTLALKKQRETELREFQTWRQNEEQRLFDHLKSKPANINDLMLFTDTTRVMREDQAARAQQVVEAQKQAVSAEDKFKTARQSYADAYRKKEKIEEHKSIWMEEHRLRMERNAEKEAEEFAKIQLQHGTGTL